MIILFVPHRKWRLHGGLFESKACEHTYRLTPILLLLSSRMSCKPVHLRIPCLALLVINLCLAVPATPSGQICILRCSYGVSCRYQFCIAMQHWYPIYYTAPLAHDMSVRIFIGIKRSCTEVKAFATQIFSCREAW